MLRDTALVERFRADLDSLSPAHERIGIAVSGGPDSLALLLLAAGARPSQVEAATVDHTLRAESRAEAELVASTCAQLGVPHTILTARWKAKPVTAIQEQAREARYDLLGQWIADRGLYALATAHHADDQAETVLMRLNRGSGLRGLAGMRAKSMIPGSRLHLIRPLLGWRRHELEDVCVTAGLRPIEDPSNSDEQFERVRTRRGLADASWLDAPALAQSALHLGSADDAIDWMTESLALARVTDDGDALRIDPDGLPAELQRRLLLHVFARFHAPEPRGPELSRATAALAGGATVTLSGLKLQGGPAWRISKAPPRR